MVVFVLKAIINMRGVLAAMAKKSNWTLSIIVFVSALMSAASFGQISLRPMTGAEITGTLFGQTVTGEYPTGARWAERFNHDGTSDYSENGVPKRGAMTLNGNTLCFTYQWTPELTGGCFEVWKRGQNCFDFYGTPVSATLDQMRFGRGWSARAWIENQPSTCLSEEIS